MHLIRLTIVSLVIILSGGGVFAAATQGAVLGPSQNPDFPVLVQGSDGVVYECRDAVEVRLDGVPIRRCLAQGQAGLPVGTGIAGGSGIVAGVVALAVVSVAASGDDAGVTTTTE